MCGSFTNKLWVLEERVLRSLRPILLWILCLTFMYNLIRFTDICLQILLTIIPAKHDITLDHVMTRPLIWTACTAVALWICIHWVPADTADIPRVFLLFLSSADKFRVSDTIRTRESRCEFFRISLCQSTDQCSVVGEHRGKIWKEMGQNERKVERKKERENVPIN
jgi:hypothetical protein